MLKIGKVHPAILLLNSQSIIGVNLLKIAEDKPNVIDLILKELIKLASENKINPNAKHEFSYKEIHAAHDGLEKGNFTGKSFINWEE